MAIELKTLRKELVYKQAAPISSILQDFNELATTNSHLEVKQQPLNQLLKGAIIIVIVLVILIVFVPFLPISLLIILLLSFISVAIFAGIARLRYKGVNLPDQRCELLHNILHMLERDIDASTAIETTVVFSSPTQKDKCIGKTEHPYQSGFKLDLFEDRWLNIQGSFLDRTIFLLTITDLYQTKYGWKKIGRKNKYKSKSKSKGVEATLKLTYFKKRYGAAKVLKGKVKEAVKLPQSALIKNLRITDKYIQLTTKMPPPSDNNVESIYQTVAMMYLSLYQVLNLADLLTNKKEA
jgi:hypothetical protein